MLTRKGGMMMRPECREHYTPARDNQNRATARYYKDTCPYCEIDRLNKKLELSHNETMHESNRVVDLERQLTEARADNERLKEQIYDSIPMWQAKDLVYEARQEAAREIVEFLDVCCMSRSAEMIVERFGLEG